MFSREDTVHARVNSVSCSAMQTVYELKTATLKKKKICGKMCLLLAQACGVVVKHMDCPLLLDTVPD